MLKQLILTSNFIPLFCSWVLMCLERGQRRKEVNRSTPATSNTFTREPQLKLINPLENLQSHPIRCQSVDVSRRFISIFSLMQFHRFYMILREAENFETGFKLRPCLKIKTVTLCIRESIFQEYV